MPQTFLHIKPYFGKICNIWDTNTTDMAKAQPTLIYGPEAIFICTNTAWNQFASIFAQNRRHQKEQKNGETKMFAPQNFKNCGPVCHTIVKIMKTPGIL